MYTTRHTQWYYFRIQGTTPGVTYRFKIINLHKQDSLYNHGRLCLLFVFLFIHYYLFCLLNMLIHVFIRYNNYIYPFFICLYHFLEVIYIQFLLLSGNYLMLSQNTVKLQIHYICILYVQILCVYVCVICLGTFRNKYRRCLTTFTYLRIII